MYKLLLIEDDDVIVKALSYSLNQDGYDVVVCKHKDDLRKVDFSIFHIILLDITLPDLSGFDLCKEIKANYQVPIIFLTAKDEEDDIVHGFSLGCDDYITKPFKTRELLARINRIVHKDNQYITCRNLKIDLSGQKVYVADNLIELTTLEYKILLLLIQNIGHIVTRQYIMNNIWDYYDNFVNDNTLTVYIKRIRTKLQDDKLITTIKGIGYRIDRE